MRSGDCPGLQNRRAAGYPVAGGFDPHSLPPFFNGLAGFLWLLIAVSILAARKLAQYDGAKRVPATGGSGEKFTPGVLSTFLADLGRRT
jgi:hypothetical protein